MPLDEPETVRYASTQVVTTPSTAEQVDSIATDPYAERRARMYKIEQALYLLFGVIEALIAIRFLLRLLAANPVAAFVSLIYGVTAPLVAPFVGIFGNVRASGSVLELQAIVALIVYALLAWLLVKVAWLVFGETRTGTAATTRSAVTKIS